MVLALTKLLKYLLSYTAILFARKLGKSYIINLSKLIMFFLHYSNQGLNMSLISTTLTILCLMSAPQPETDPFYDHLQSHKIEKNPKFTNFLNVISQKLKPSSIYDYTDVVIDNCNSRLDYDSLEHFPEELQEFLVKEPMIDKKVILETYNLNACGLKATQLIDLFNFVDSKITLAIDSGKYLRLLSPQGILKNHSGVASKSLPENLIASVWSVMDDLDTNERVITLHLFFSDEKGMSKWLDQYQNPPLESINTDSLLVGAKQDSDEFVSMGLAEFPLRLWKCLNYKEEPLHPYRYTHAAIEEVNQCDTFIASVIASQAKHFPVRFEQLTYALGSCSTQRLL